MFWPTQPSSCVSKFKGTAPSMLFLIDVFIFTVFLSKVNVVAWWMVNKMNCNINCKRMLRYNKVNEMSYMLAIFQSMKAM